MIRAATQATIERALGAGDIAAAAAAAERALAAGEDAPILLNLAAWAREEAEDYTGAHALLSRALAQAPDDATILAAIGALLRKERRFEEARAMVERALARAPQHAAGWLEHGYVLDATGSSAAAADSYRRALALDPTLAPALGKLAAILARNGDAAGGRDHATRALAISPGEPAAVAALASIEVEGGEPVAAEARLRALIAGGLRGDDRTRALTLLGDALDKQDRTDDAFATWTSAQQAFRDAWARWLAPTPERPSHRAFVARIAAQVAAAPPPARATVAPVADEATRHVFLLGYPRSGTTLVENVLASAPGVVALEERETLAATDGVLVANDGAMADLGALDAALVTRLRADYWNRVRTWGGEVAGRTFVDMNPLSGIKLPVIARLFPDARIVVMRRDPRDVVLSCFRINFTPSTAAWAFSELEEAARHYATLMELTQTCLATLPLAFHELRYDRLVADFEGTTRALAAFVGIDWTEDFRTFDRTAQTRGVRTASASQVRRGLYDGRGQWRRYERELAPALPILAPWVERLGFER